MPDDDRASILQQIALKSIKRAKELIENWFQFCFQYILLFIQKNIQTLIVLAENLEAGGGIRSEAIVELKTTENEA